MKKIIYIILTIILGIMLSFLAHSFMEIRYLKWAAANGKAIIWSNGCALPLYLNYGLLLIGAVGGYFLGQTWWRIVYVEKRRWGKRAKKS